MFAFARADVSAFILGLCIAVLPLRAYSADILVPSEQPTIQDAISIAQSGDVILLDPGVYAESLDLLGKAITIKGPFGAASTIIQSNTGTVVLAHNVNGVVRLEGLTIRDGVNPGIGNGAGIIAQNSTIEIVDCTLSGHQTTDGGGAAIFAQSSNLFITRSSIVDNFTLRDVEDVVGGAIYLVDSNLTALNSEFSRNGGQNVSGAAVGATGTGLIHLTSCTIANNSTRSSDGGAISIANGASLQALDSTFSSNSTTLGGTSGAIHIFNTAAAANLTLTGCTFTSNTSSSSGGAIGAGSGSAGGVFSISGCTFENNTSIAGNGGAISVSSTTNPSGGGVLIHNCIFRGNRAASGGALRVRPLAVISESLFENNGATGATSGSFVLTGGGGAIVLDSSPAGTRVDRCTFRNNYTLTPTSDGGGAIRARTGNVLFDNCLFEDNIANGNGPGALALEGRATGTVPTYTVKNSTFNRNLGGAGFLARGGAIGTTRRMNVTVESSVFQSNTAEQAGHLYFESPQNVTLRDLTLDGGGAISRPDGNGGDYGGISIAFVTQNVVLERISLSNVSGKIYGGIRISSSGPVLVDTVSIRNASAVPLANGNWGDYGGMSINTTSTATVENLLLEDCTAKRYGGLDITGSSVSVTDSTFRRCVSQQTATGSWGEGGGLYTTSANVELRGLLFDSCRARIGGGLLVSGGGTSFVLADSTFINCTAEPTPTNGSGEGGGARITRTGAYSFNNLKFINCHARVGGGLWVDNGSITLTNSLFAGNTSTAGDGGGFTVRPSAFLEVVNCTVADNEGGGGYFASSLNGFVVNSIFYHNTSAPNIETNGATPIGVTYSNVQGGAVGFGNIDQDPLFIDVHNQNYSLSPGSPAIDAGDNNALPASITTDLLGQPRLVDDPSTLDTGQGSSPLIDMGAYEFAGSAPCLADYNFDGGVDGGDIEAFFGDWELGAGFADINLDGGIDGADVEAFFTIWEAGGC